MHLEGVAKATDSILSNCYPTGELGKPIDLHPGDSYMGPTRDLARIAVTYECRGHKYTVEVTRQ